MQPKPVASDTSAGKTVGTARRCAAAASGPQPSADWTAGSELRVVFPGLVGCPCSSERHSPVSGPYRRAVRL